jgi:rhodanese-related sulfurtransferase
MNGQARVANPNHPRCLTRALRWCGRLGFGLALFLVAACNNESLPGDAGLDDDSGPSADGAGDSNGDQATPDGEESPADGSDPGPAALTPLSPQELQTALESKNFPLINVHIPRQGEIPGTDIHISYLDPDALADYLGDDLERYAVIYCRSDRMALIAGEDLLARGYRAIAYLQGGMLAWQAAGYRLDP